MSVGFPTDRDLVAEEGRLDFSTGHNREHEGGRAGFPTDRNIKPDEVERASPLTMTMTMTMTLSEKSHINQMRAWPYRQECRDHGPSKKNLSYWGSLLLGKVCKYKLLWTECNAS